MAGIRTKNKKTWIILAAIIMALFVPAYSVSAVQYEKNFDSSELVTVSGENIWQIIRGGFVGVYEEGDVSQEFDKVANVSYSSDNAVRMTKNVISSDTENKFTMYLNVEPQVSWEEILQLNTIKVSGNNRPISPPEWPSGGGTTNYFSPVETNDCRTPVIFSYYAVENGVRITLAEVTMYCSTNRVPNGGIGIGNPLLAPEGESFYAINNFNFKGSGMPRAEIDISVLYEKYDFSIEKVYPDKVIDVMGDNIVIHSNSLNYDGGSCSVDENTLNWTLPDTDLGLLPYEMDASGNVTPSGVLRELENGKSTYYRQQAYQCTYKFTLDVQGNGFVSAESGEPSVNTIANYAVQTNKSPNDNDREKGGVVLYKVGTNGDTKSGHFKSPYVKGLLYDLQFQKVIRKTDVPLEGIEFKLIRLFPTGIATRQTEWTAKTDKDGNITFKDVPWGWYRLEEIAYNDDLSSYAGKFQQEYLKPLDPTPKPIKADDRIGNANKIIGDGECAVVSWTLQRDRLQKETRDDKSVWVYKFTEKFLNSENMEGESQEVSEPEGRVGNEPYTAQITIKKEIDDLGQVSGSLKDDLENAQYKVLLKSVENEDKEGGWDEYKAAYLYPEEDEPMEPETLKVLKEEKLLKHQESETYKVIIPKDGAEVELKEIISEELLDKIAYKDIEIEKNTLSTELGKITKEENGATIKVKPGNDMTITIKNVPLGKVTIQKVVDNYADYGVELAEDEFMITVDSLKGAEVHTAMVLKHGEKSAKVIVKEETTLKIQEIMPKEYGLQGISINSVAPTISGNELIVKPGEEITVYIHNKYQWQPYFHSVDTVGNHFKVILNN